MRVKCGGNAYNVPHLLPDWFPAVAQIPAAVVVPAPSVFGRIVPHRETNATYLLRAATIWVRGKLSSFIISESSLRLKSSPSHQYSVKPGSVKAIGRSFLWHGILYLDHTYPRCRQPIWIFNTKSKFNITMKISFSVLCLSIYSYPKIRLFWQLNVYSQLKRLFSFKRIYIGTVQNLKQYQWIKRLFIWLVLL